MRSASGLMMALSLFLAGVSGAHAADPTPPADAPVAGATRTFTFSTRPPPSSSRLKYRNGPVCMCSGGLNEADIRRAQNASPVEAPADAATQNQDEEKAP